MRILAGEDLATIAFKVCTTLSRSGVTAVLTGGSAATVYAPEAYQSRDLDFVLQLSHRESVSDQPLQELGFERKGQAGFYSHALTHLTLEFPAGPLAVGADLVTHWDTLLRDPDLILHVITPTDCVRDRLAAAIHWNDFSSLQQAVAVAKRHKIDLETVAAWCARERGEKQLGRFLELLKSS